MSNDKQAGSDLISGSPATIQTGPSQTGEQGQPGVASGDASTGQTNQSNLTDAEREELTNLRSKIGEQGQKMGEWEKFGESLAPLLEKLDSQPEVIQAIMEGKIDSKLAQAAIDGKINLEAATVVTQAQKDVKAEVGNKAFQNMNPEELEAKILAKASELVREEVSKVQQGVKTDISQIESQREFDSNMREFVASHPDFPDLASSIWEWFEEHPDQWDVSVAYDAVKGKKLADESAKKADEDGGEGAKNIALNASGGGQMSTGVIRDSSVVDQLISGRSNPNAL